MLKNEPCTQTKRKQRVGGVTLVSCSTRGWFQPALDAGFFFFFDLIPINASICSRKPEFGAGGGASFTGKPAVGAALAACGVTRLRCLC